MSPSWLNKFEELHGRELQELSKKLWSYAEPALEEYRSSSALIDYLVNQGFSVRRGLAGLDTAFLAQWGFDSPRILFLAEYDALQNAGQAAVSHESPIVGKGGHACGHCLLGVGAVGAAVALKERMEKMKLHGSVAVMGCPAEETMTGKIRLAQEGYFDNFDVALTWHPEAINQVSELRYQAMRSVYFSFRGTPAHAAISPDAGRSALDAVELMNVGVNYLREHIHPGARIHYVTVNGGKVPNVVPDYAKSWYFIRTPRDDLQKDIYARVCRIAQGAALMTDTEVTIDEITACPATKIYPDLNKVLFESFEEVGTPSWTNRELAFGREIQRTLPVEQLTGQIEDCPRLKEQGPLDTGLTPLSNIPKPFPASSDVSAVSARIPTGQITVACFPVGTAGHTWPITACSGSEIGWRGMMTASKVLALTGSKLLQDPQMLKSILSKNKFI